MTTRNRTTTQAHDAQIIVGIAKNMQSASTLFLDATSYTPATLVEFFQGRIDAANTVATTRAAWLFAVSQYEERDAKGAAVTQGLKQHVMNTFGKKSPKLTDFGFVPPKTRTLTPEQKVAAVAKRAATRKARNTLGKKAKLTIKGTLTPAEAAGVPAHATMAAPAAAMTATTRTIPSPIAPPTIAAAPATA